MVATKVKLKRMSLAGRLASLVGLGFELPHLTEDFAYNVPTRFGIDSGPAAFLVGVALLVQLGVAGLAIRRNKAGLLGVLGLSIFWIIAAVLDHAGDLLSFSFRHPPLSHLLILGIILAQGFAAFYSFQALQKTRSR